MIDIAAHISLLLSQNELVIVPNLGGFLPQAHQASIHHSEHRIYPPGTHVIFNSQLCDSDGLLAHHIADKEQIDYKKVLQALETFALLCKQEMQIGNTILFEKMGILSYNTAQKISFKPFTLTNHNEAQFALPSLSLMPIVRQERTIVKLDKQIPQDIKAQRNIIRGVAAALVPLLLFGFLAYQWLPLHNAHRVNMSIIPQDLITEEVINQEATNSITYTTNYSADRETVDKGIKPEPAAIKINEITEDTEVKVLDVKKITEPIAESTNKKETATELTLGKYHIIAGAFKTEERALLLIESLKTEGYKAYLAGKTPGGKHLVSSANFNNKLHALHQLRAWQADDKPDWWLFIK